MAYRQEPDVVQHELEEFLEASLSPSDETRPKLVSQHIESTIGERQRLGTSLLEASVEWKRTMSPMLTFVLVQEAMIILYRSKGWGLMSILTRLTHATPSKKCAFVPG